MHKDRAAGIVIHNNKLLIMYRKNAKEYYVFPGGGVEDNDTKEQTVLYVDLKKKLRLMRK